MTDTPHLALPLLAASQSQKHVTHNQAIVLLDAIVQLSVIDSTHTAPPGAPAEGDRYRVASGATGTWAGWDLNIALYKDGQWIKLVPKKGWSCYDEALNTYEVWNGAAWTDFGYITAAEAGNGSLTELGILTAADATNRLAVKSNAILFSHDDVTPGTGDLRVTLNKSAAAKDASFVFQDAFSTRALFGLLGDDNTTLKVTPDGSTYKTAFVVDKSTGQLDLSQGPKFSAYINFDQYVAANVWTKVGINNTHHNDFAAFDAANNRFVAPAAGYYLFGAKFRFKANAAVPTSIKIGFGKNNAPPATADDECTMQGAIVTLVSSVQHMQLYKLAANDTVDVRAYMVTNDGYCESAAVSFWGCRVA